MASLSLRLSLRLATSATANRLALAACRTYIRTPAKSAWVPTAPEDATTAFVAKASTTAVPSGADTPLLIETGPTSASTFKVTSDIPPSALPELSDAVTDWSRSYFGLSSQAFSKEIADILLSPIDPLDVEIKPDGLIYLPEIKYRRVLNKAFGPGGWGLAPRSETNVGSKIVSREYALVCQGRLVAIARGEQEYFDPSGIATATESCKSNALMRCCKDLGVASELWDPRFIREFKTKYCLEVYAEHVPTKKRKKLWRRKDQPKLGYPYQE